MPSKVLKVLNISRISVINKYKYKIIDSFHNCVEKRYYSVDTYS